MKLKKCDLCGIVDGDSAIGHIEYTSPEDSTRRVCILRKECGTIYPDDITGLSFDVCDVCAVKLFQPMSKRKLIPSKQSRERESADRENANEE